jgi:hypothetical protein
MSHKVTFDADYNNFVITHEDQDTGTITQEYFISAEDLDDLLGQLHEAQVRLKIDKMRENLWRE